MPQVVRHHTTKNTVFLRQPCQRQFCILDRRFQVPHRIRAGGADGEDFASQGGALLQEDVRSRLHQAFELREAALHVLHVQSDDARPGVGQHEGRFVTAERRWQCLDPPLECGNLATLEHGRIGLGDRGWKTSERCGQIVVLGRQCVMDRVVRRASRCVPLRRPAMQCGHQVGLFDIEAGAEKIAEQMMVSRAARSWALSVRSSVA